MLGVRLREDVADWDGDSEIVGVVDRVSLTLGVLDGVTEIVTEILFVTEMVGVGDSTHCNKKFRVGMS